MHLAHCLDFRIERYAGTVRKIIRYIEHTAGEVIAEAEPLCLYQE